MLTKSLSPGKMLNSEEELKLEKNLVWIFGANRSGTSWLRRQLWVKNQTEHLLEPLIGQHLGIFKMPKGEVERSLEINGKNENYFFAEKFSKVWKVYLRKLILNRIYAQFKNLDKKIIIKEPNGSLGADIISDCLPSSKIIIIFRDGRDVIDSRLDALSGGISTKTGWSVLTSKDRVPFVKRESKIWVSIIKNLLKTYQNHNKNLKILIHYEDLLKNPFVELKKIYNLISINITDDELQKKIEKQSYKNVPEKLKGKGKLIRTASPGKWRENLNSEEQKIMQKIMKDTLKKIGYPEK